MNEPQQIIKAFDEHFEKFQWRIRKLEKDIEVEAYRQLVDSLEQQIKAAGWRMAKMDAVFKAIGVKPEEHKEWARKLK